MRNWIACWSFLILFLSASIFLCTPVQSQSQHLRESLTNNRNVDGAANIGNRLQNPTMVDTLENNTDSDLPSPQSVVYKSMIVPGWGQIINNQTWKVPIIYGILGGLGYYSVHLTKRYHDYRAAFYNLNPDTPDDLRFGPTPSYIPESANLREVRTLRNQYRNNRDLAYIGIVLAYGLNMVDAYVFAHMRSFDVSEDLSMRPRIKPGIMAHTGSPGFTLSIDLIANK